jgi:Beta-propeller repeat
VRYLKIFVLWAAPLALLHAQTATFANFQGSGASSIQALAADEAGNIYVAGTTAASDLPMKNAMQPQIGEAPLVSSTDGGQTWRKLPNVPAGTLEVAPHPANPQVLLIGGGYGIDKSTDGGQTWQHVYSWRADSLALRPSRSRWIRPTPP